MKNRIITHHLFLVLLAFAALVLTSCGGLASSKSEGHFSISFSNQNTRIAIAETDTLTYTITLSSTKNNSYRQTQSGTLTVGTFRKATFTFTDIPLNLELVINAYFETDKGACFGGESGFFKLTSADTKQITVELQKLFSTPYLLLTKPDNNTFESLKQFDSLKLDPLIDINEGDYGSFTNYCYDSNGTLWFITKSNSGYELYTLAEGESEPDQFVQLEDEIVDIDCDYTDNSLTMMYYASADLIARRGDLKNGTAPDYKYSDPETMSYTIKGGAAGNGNYYIYGLDGEFETVKEPWIARAVLTENPAGNTFTLENKLYINNPAFGLMLDGINFDTFAITDMKVQDGKVFVLFKQTCENYDSYLFLQRGGLLVFKDTGTGFVYERTVGLSSIKSQNFQKQVTNSDRPLFKDMDGTPWIENLQVFLGFPYKSELDRFFCVPQKFVATKPKRLAIADQGSFVYFDGNGELTSDVSSRIVEIDLETFSFSNTTVEVMEFNTRGGCNFAIEQNLDKLESSLYYFEGSGYWPLGSNYLPRIVCGSIPYYK